MARVSAGVFTCDNNDLQIAVDGVDGNEFATPDELVSFEITIDNNEETWTSYTSQGWENALVTGKNYSISMTCKRVIGDPVQEYLVGLVLKKGTDCQTMVKAVLANGMTITDRMNVKVSNIGAGGEGTNVAELVVDFSHAKGVPTVTQTPAA